MTRRVILGMGAGICRLKELAELLTAQPESRVSHEDPPHLPWEQNDQAPGIAERLTRLRQVTTERFYGDVASFYLPYAEEAIACEPEIRIVCLKQAREVVMAGFIRGPCRR